MTKVDSMPETFTHKDFFEDEKKTRFFSYTAEPLPEDP